MYVSLLLFPSWKSINRSIPGELANLRNLTSLILDNSDLFGTLPVALGNLSKIERLHLSSNKFTGEIREVFARLTSLKELMLRSCNLIGEIPVSFGTSFTTIHVLDLSFNRLSGKIPEELSALALTNLFLNGNNFTGTVPSWMLNTNVKIDLSYNNFTDTGVSDCQQNSP
ncbi:hypothetical protein Gotur_034658 [Gossypium turneri]